MRPDVATIYGSNAGPCYHHLCIETPWRACCGIKTCGSYVTAVAVNLLKLSERGKRKENGEYHEYTMAVKGSEVGHRKDES